LQKDYKRMKPIIDPLASFTGDTTIEDVLSRLQEGVKDNPYRAAQLMSARFYIRKVIADTENSWCRTDQINTNWMTLLHRLSDHIDIVKDLTIVTLNYDRLIEDAISTFGIPQYRHMNDYLSSKRPKLLKVHGSVHWYSPLHNETFTTKHTNEERYIENAAELVEGQFPVLAFDPDPHLHFNGLYHLPAIAVPVRQKLTFMCPPEQKEAFITAIQEATHLLSIGWRGADGHITDAIHSHLSTDAPMTVICKTVDDSKDVIENITGYRVFQPSQYRTRMPRGGGFTAFLRNDWIEEFLNQLNE